MKPFDLFFLNLRPLMTGLQCKFTDVIRRSGDLILFPKSNILCDLQSHIPQIYMYVLIIHTEDKSFLDYDS